MSFYETGNPVPSIDPRDLDDNAKHIDEIVNSTLPTFTDRLGAERRTLAGIEADADAATLRGDLAATEGAALVGWQRGDLVEKISTSEGALNSQTVSLWEFEDSVTDKPVPSDPSTWDWAPAINFALSQYGECKLFNGKIGVATPIIMVPGSKLFGYGPSYAGGTAYSNIFGSTLVPRSDFVGTSVIKSSITSPDNVLTSVQLSQFRLDLNMCAENGIVLTDIYDGAILDNLHIIGVAPNKRGLWFAEGSYGLGQTVTMRSVQIIVRDNSSATVSPFRADALNESVFTNCKFFASSGGVNASLGACIELSGCGGILFDGCSTAFGDVGASLVDHASRKNYGITFNGCTFEALRTTALKIRSSNLRKATEIYLRSTRYYDSVFTMTNAIDIDSVGNSTFECSFKRAIVGSGADQNTITIQRQNFVTNSGVSTLILSQPNAIDTYYGVSTKIRALSGFQSDGMSDLGGGVSYFVRTFTAATGTISSFDGVIIVNRTALATYTLPPANAQGANRTILIRLRSIGSSAVNINAAGSDTVNGGASTSLGPAPASMTLASDGISAWYSV